MTTRTKHVAPVSCSSQLHGKEIDAVPQSAGARKQDAFPPTMRTWIGSKLDEGDVGRATAFHHVMSVYAEPLKVYFRGCSMRFLGDADDMVQGFFADRLSREAFLDRWRESGRPLRYWLIVGFKHFLMEESRRMRRGRASALPDEMGQSDDQPEAEYDRECALSLVREALTKAQSQCEEAGLNDHWRIFIRHHLEGDSYADISKDEGIDTRRAAVMARTAANKLRASLRDLAGWDDAEPGEVDREVRELMEALER